MIIKENTTIYQCSFCSKYLQRKHAMEAHEKKCSKNHENFNKCDGCKFLQQIDSTYTVDCDDGFEREIKCNSFKCAKLEKNLFPRKVLYKGILDKYPETFENSYPMPNEIEGCEHFDIGFFDKD